MKNDVVTIEEEAEIVLHYFTIQRFRFEERLVFELDIEPAVKNAACQSLSSSLWLKMRLHTVSSPSLNLAIFTLKHIKKAGLYI